MEITSTITEIGETCFQYATNLTYVSSKSSTYTTIGHQMIVTGGDTISACAVDIIIDDLVKIIGYNAFRGLVKLTSVTMGGTCNNDRRTLLLLEYIDWNTAPVTTVENFAFSGTGLSRKPVVLPTTLKEISKSFFCLRKSLVFRCRASKQFITGDSATVALESMFPCPK